MFALALAAVLAAPARANWFVQDAATVGSAHYFGNDARAVVDTGAGWGFNAGDALYSYGYLPGTVHTYSAGATWLRQTQRLDLEGYVMPQRFGSEAEGASLTSNWLLYQDEDAHTLALLGADWARHRSPFAFDDGSQQNSTYSQYGLQTTIDQAYFHLFEFLVGGTYFLYDRNLSSVASDGSLFDSGRFGLFTALRPITPLPRWSASIEFVRYATGKEEPVNLFAGYTRIGFADGPGFAQSAIAGFDVKYADNWHLDVTYNYYNPSNGPSQHYVSGLVRIAP